MSARQQTEKKKKEVGLLTPLRVKTKKRIPPHVLTRRRNLLTRVVGKERNIRHSPWRMNLVCQFIAGMTVPEALIQLDYCEKKRGAPILKKVLQRTVNLADIQHSLAPSQLTVEECFATPGTPLKRLKIMGRGRSGVKHRKHSHIRLVLAETDFALQMAQAPNGRQEERWYQRLQVAAEDAQQKREEQEKLNALLAEKEKKQAEQEAEANETDHILFIASGAFHFCKPSDLLAELQGRLPIRVELKPLTEHDLYRILTEPDHNLVRQQNALMEAEGVQLDITDEAKKSLAKLSTQINREVENIGARRLHTLVERLMEDLSFSATERAGEKVTMGEEDVQKAVGDLLGKTDLSRFIL